MSGMNPALLRLTSPLGRIEVTADDAGIRSLAIETDGHLPFDGSPERPSPVLLRAVEQLNEYFAGIRTSFDVPVHLTRGTEFQRSVWARLATLEFGAVISYGALGSAIGRAGSGRAIGGAVGANPVPIIIGCHRVLATSGQITGYSAGQGTPTKAWLLDHEGIAHR